MGRPRKDSNAPEARKRLVDALWELLETRNVHEVTVGAVAERAGCNRGTFYYHFVDMDELVLTAIEGELLGEHPVPEEIFRLITGLGPIDAESPLKLDRLRLVMERGGASQVETMVKLVVGDLWRAVLCRDGSDFEPETRLIFEYAVSGILGVIAYADACAELDERANPFESRFVQENAVFLLGQLSEAQGIPQNEILTRFATASRIMRVSGI